MAIKCWFDGGFHAVIGTTHLLFDPVKKYYPPHPDPPRSKKPDLVLVTHGHTDHSNDVGSYPDVRKVMHRATDDFLRYYYKFVKNVIFLEKITAPGIIEDTYKPIKFKGLRIEAFNAGHTVGSVQFKITSPEGTLVFTGDANSTGTTVMQPAPVLEADILAIEGTMGHPAMISPTRSEAYQVIHDFMEDNFNDGHDMVVFFGHAIGKGQEITKIVNSLQTSTGKQLFVERKTFDANGIYEKYLIPLGNYGHASSIDGNGGKKVIFMDLAKLVHSKLTAAKKFKLEKEPPSMLVTAFAHDYEKKFSQLKISSHDDWNGLNAYVDKSVRKQDGKVVVFHGFSGIFSAHLKKRGFDATDSHHDIFTA